MPHLLQSTQPPQHTRHHHDQRQRASTGMHCGGAAFITNSKSGFIFGATTGIGGGLAVTGLSNNASTHTTPGNGFGNLHSAQQQASYWDKTPMPAAQVESRVISAIENYAKERREEIVDGVDGKKERLPKDVVERVEKMGKQVTVETHFGDLGFDELDIVEALLAVEEDFDCIIPDEDCDEFMNVSAVVDYMKNYVDENATAAA